MIRWFSVIYLFILSVISWYEGWHDLKSTRVTSGFVLFFQVSSVLLLWQQLASNIYVIRVVRVMSGHTDLCSGKNIKLLKVSKIQISSCCESLSNDRQQKARNLLDPYCGKQHMGHHLLFYCLTCVKDLMQVVIWYYIYYIYMSWTLTRLYMWCWTEQSFSASSW